MTHLHTFPADVVDALKQGNKIEAIRRLRAATKVGLAEAKAAIDAAEGHGAFASGTHSPAHSVGARTTLSPGEVPRSGGNKLAHVVIALVAAGARWLLRKIGGWPPPPPPPPRGGEKTKESKYPGQNLKN